MNHPAPAPDPEFIQLLTTNQSRIYAYILSLVFVADDADDILQQTNAILWEKSSDFELGSNFIAWSFRISYYQVLAYRKQQQRERLVFDDNLLEDIAELSCAKSEEYGTKHRLLRQCLENLSDRQRESIRRRYHMGATLETIATETQMTVNALKQLLFRARNSLQRCVESKLSVEE